MTLTHAIVPHYFTRRMILACSLTSFGSSISLIVMPVLLTRLIDEYEFRGASLIIGAITLNCCAASLVFHPIEWHSNIRPTNTVAQKNAEDDAILLRILNCIKRMLKTAQDNLWLFKCMQASLINIILSINTMAFSNFMYLVPFAMEAAGNTAEETGLAISGAGVCLLVTRIVYPILFIRFKMRHQIGVMSSAAISGTSIVGKALSVRLSVCVCYR